MSKRLGPSKSNTSLLVEHGRIISIAILDSGAGISVTTKEKWGKPTVKNTQMNLQLADGKLQNPIGILEDISLTSCGIEYTHTFAIVDFGQEVNYEMILGQTFMRQFSMVQDWGYDYIYLRHESAITKVNLRHHSYRDVTHMPMEEFDSGSFECSTHDLEHANNPNLWLCGASKSSMQTDGSQWCKEVLDEDYMPYPFQEH